MQPGSPEARVQAGLSSSLEAAGGSLCSFQHLGRSVPWSTAPFLHLRAGMNLPVLLSATPSSDLAPPPPSSTLKDSRDDVGHTEVILSLR